MKFIWKLAITMGCATVPVMPAGAQLFFIGVRAGAGIPTGGFSETGQGATSDPLLRGAKPGVGYGLDGGLGLGPIGLYASTDHIEFDCRSGSCESSGKYKLSGVSGGLRMGVPLFPIIKPWAKAGLTWNDVSGTLGGSSGPKITTTKRPGYELGAGFDVPVLGFFSITPQVRYFAQKVKYRMIFVDDIVYSGTKEMKYYTFDLGFRFKSPI